MRVMSEGIGLNCGAKVNSNNDCATAVGGPVDQLKNKHSLPISSMRAANALVVNGCPKSKL